MRNEYTYLQQTQVLLFISNGCFIMSVTVNFQLSLFQCSVYLLCNYSVRHQGDGGRVGDVGFGTPNDGEHRKRMNETDLAVAQIFSSHKQLPSSVQYSIGSERMCTQSIFSIILLLGDPPRESLSCLDPVTNLCVCVWVLLYMYNTISFKSI